MRELYSSEIEKLLDSRSEFSTKDFFEVMKECPAPTVYSRIRALVTKGILTQIGKGKYAKGKSEAFSFTPGAKAKKIYKELSEAFPMTSICVWQLAEVNNFTQHLINYDAIIVDVDRDSVESVYWALKQKNDKVITVKKMFDDISLFKDYIIIRNLVSDAPCEVKDNIKTPTLEKFLVDIVCDKEFVAFHGREGRHIFETAAKQYPINESRLLRYAGRKNKRDFITDMYEVINRQ